MTGILMLPVAVLKAWPRNARLHPPEQVKQLAQSIRRFGFTHPILIDEDDRILAGHGRALAAREIGMAQVPCLRIDHLSPAEKRAYVLADNKLALNAQWDREILADELAGLIDDDILLETGFSLVEVEGLIAGDPAETNRRQKMGAAPQKRCRTDDIWRLGSDWLVCGAALKADMVNALIAGQQALLLIARPADGTVTEDGDWAGATFLSAVKAGRRVIMTESNAAHCDRILQRWEAQTKRTATRFSPDPRMDTTEMPA